MIKFTRRENCSSVFLLCLLLLLAAQSNAEPETYYQEKHCKGEMEVVLSDRTRVDCLTETHAIEYDFGKKWAEAIGQALGYSIETGKKPGIVLILREEKDYKYWIKLNSVLIHHKIDIDTWKIEAYK